MALLVSYKKSLEWLINNDNDWFRTGGPPTITVKFLADMMRKDVEKIRQDLITMEKKGTLPNA